LVLSIASLIDYISPRKPFNLGLCDIL